MNALKSVARTQRVNKTLIHIDMGITTAIHISSWINNWVLKGLAQAKIIKKSVILFWLFNMNIWCKYVHRLELQSFVIFVLRIYQLG